MDRGRQQPGVGGGGCLGALFYRASESCLDVAVAGVGKFDLRRRYGGRREEGGRAQMPVPGKAPFLERTTMPRSWEM